MLMLQPVTLSILDLRIFSCLHTISYTDRRAFPTGINTCFSAMGEVQWGGGLLLSKSSEVGTSNPVSSLAKRI